MKKTNNWTDQQDKLLLQLYNQSGCFQKWKYISKNLSKNGFTKNQIQCRQRFVNKLNPELRKDKLQSSQLKQLFTYYDSYGPMWSVFETLILGRSQNLLKNKFYSTLRSLVRALISLSQEINHEKSHICSSQLSSKILVQMYQGKKNFRKFKGFLRSLLKKLGFEVDLDRMNFIKNQVNLQIIQKLKSMLSKTKIIKQNKPVKQKNQNESASKKIQSNTNIGQSQKLQFHVKSFEQQKEIVSIERQIMVTQLSHLSLQPAEYYTVYFSPICVFPIWNYNNLIQSQYIENNK